MRKELLAALGGLLVALGTACADELAEEPLRPIPAPAGTVTDKGTKGGPAAEFGVTFGQGLPSQVPWAPPPFPLTTPNDPRVPLPYFSPPPPGPSPEQLARIPGGSRFWGGIEYLMWWDKKAPLPSDFITTGSPRDAVPGALGQPNTHVFYTSPVVDFYQIQGLRITAGGWFDAEQMLGLEGSGFLLEKRTHVFQAKSDALGNPFLAFAHFDPLPRGSPDAFVASEQRGGKAGPFTGSLSFDTDTQLWGTEANLVHALFWTPILRVRLLGGFRYLDLDEHLAFFFQRVTAGSATVPFLGKTFPSSLELADDSFQVHNQFYGPQIGLDGQYFFGKFFVGLGGKLGMGATHEVLTVSGSSTLQPFRRPAQTAVGGLFAQPSNIGRLEADQFGVVPQAQARLGWQPVRWMRGWIGYDFLYWSQVLRPGSQVDLRVNPAEVPTDAGFKGVRTSSPAPQFNRTDFWTQGLSFGVQLTF
jgi:hypothetical protein